MLGPSLRMKKKWEYPPPPGEECSTLKYLANQWLIIDNIFTVVCPHKDIDETLF